MRKTAFASSALVVVFGVWTSAQEAKLNQTLAEDAFAIPR